MTAPFPFHPATGPQAPMLRPDPLHEEPGALGALTPVLLHVAQQIQAQQAQQDQATHLRGQLALEQDKADFEKKQANLKNKQRADAITALNTQLGVPQERPGGTALGGSGQGTDAGQPQSVGQPQPSPGQAPVAGGTIAGGGPEFERMAAMVLQQHQQVANAHIMGGVLNNYTGTALRNDPVQRAQAQNDMMTAGVNPSLVDAWDKANPARQLEFKAYSNGMAVFDKQTGELVKSLPAGANKSMSQVVQRFQMYEPQYRTATSIMKAIESNPNTIDAAKTVIAGLAAQGIKTWSIGELTEAAAKAGFSGNSAKYFDVFKNAVEASMGFQMGSRGGVQMANSIIGPALLPTMAELDSPDAMKTRWNMREQRLQGLYNVMQMQGLGIPLSPGAAPNATPEAGAPASPGGHPELDELEALAKQLGLKK